MEGSCPLFVGYKSEDVKSRGAQRDNGDTGYLSSDNSSESRGEDDADGKGKVDSGRKGEYDADEEGENGSGKEGEDDTGGKGENNVGGEGEDNDGREGENNDSGQSEDDAGGNGEILNVKLRVKNGDKTSNLGEIAASKLAFCCIANSLVDTSVYVIVAPDHFIVSLVVPVVSPFLVFPPLVVLFLIFLPLVTLLLLPLFFLYLAHPSLSAWLICCLSR